MDNIGTKLLNACFVNNIKVKNGMSLHLAIFNQPFLSYMMSGEKTIESRFSINKCSPYYKTQKGDIMFIKESGKPINAYSIIDDVKYYSKDNKTLNLKFIKENFSKGICAFSDTFWSDRNDKNFASLLWVSKPQPILSFSVDKKDKRGWIDYKLQYPKTLILLSGKIGSGKTYWAEKIACKYKCNRNSFSDYLKLCCMKEGLEVNRENLQSIGQLAIQNNFEDFMNYTVLNNFNSKSDYLIIDGLRHKECIEYFKAIIDNVIHISINPSEDFRKANIINRDGLYNKAYDNKDVERNFEELIKCANYTVDEYTDENALFCYIDNQKKQNNQLCLF